MEREFKIIPSLCPRPEQGREQRAFLETLALGSSLADVLAEDLPFNSFLPVGYRHKAHGNPDVSLRSRVRAVLNLPFSGVHCN